MAEDSYRLGQTGIAALLQALQASRDMRLRSLQTASDFQNALSELERAIGAPHPMIVYPIDMRVVAACVCIVARGCGLRQAGDRGSGDRNGRAGHDGAGGSRAPFAP